jgi:ribosomal-protein-alanine N-acetyltransferase
VKILHLDKEMTLENIDDLIKIDKIIQDDHWTEENFLRDLDRKWEFSLVALENNHIIGFLICSVKENNIHINRVAVSQEYQHKKIGRILMETLFADCNEYGVKRITLKVKYSNPEAISFYEKLGFKKVGVEGSRYFYVKEIT